MGFNIISNKVPKLPKYLRTLALYHFVTSVMGINSTL
jgi:hypothetical protein